MSLLFLADRVWNCV